MTEEGGRRGGVAGLLVLAVLAAAAWLLRDDLRGLWPDEGTPDTRASAEARAAAPAASGGASAAGAGAGGRVSAPGGGTREPGDAGEGGAAPGAEGPEPDSGSGERSARAGETGEAPDRGTGEPEGPTAGSRARRGPTADPAERLRELFGPGGSGEVRLDSADLAVLLGPGRIRPLPAGVDDPRAVPRDSVLEASADVDLERVLGDRLPALVRRMIGDSARVTAVVTPEVPARGVLRLRVRSVQAGSMTFPSAMVPWLLRQASLPTAADDPAAVELRPGGGLTGARVEGGALVLVREPGG